MQTALIIMNIYIPKLPLYVLLYGIIKICNLMLKLKLKKQFKYINKTNSHNLAKLFLVSALVFAFLVIFMVPKHLSVPPLHTTRLKWITNI